MSASMLDAVVREAPQLPFVSLVRWLEALLPGDAAVGGAGPYRDEAVRFHGSPALEFASAELAGSSLVRDADGRTRAQLAWAFSGLSGAGSPLPTPMLHDLAAADEGSAAEQALLDVFHHRLLGLCYRGLLKFDLARSSLAREAPPTFDWILGLAGLPAREAERITALPRRLLLRLCPLLISYPGNAERIAVGLRSVLDDEFGDLAVKVHELCGGRVEIEARFRARLGRDLQLGRTFVLGARVPAPNGALRVTLGPLSPAIALRLAPGGDRAALVEATVALLCPETVDADVEITLTHGRAMRLREPTARLGRSAWLGSCTRPRPIRWRIAKRDAESALA